MSILSTLMQEAATVAETPVVIPYSFTDVPVGYTPEEAITIRPITVETWFRIRPLLASIEAEDVRRMTAGKADSETDGAPTPEALEALEKYGETVFEIVLLGIHNRHGEPSEPFREALKRNATWGDLYILLNAIFYRLGGQSFSNSITALKAVSPLGEREMIALQKNAISWRLKAASASLQQQTKPSDTHTAKPSEAPLQSCSHSCENAASSSTDETGSSTAKPTKTKRRKKSPSEKAKRGATRETLKPGK